ncbi:MAG: hypothetical protein RIK87_12565 [Fuerstiella sp.]
MTRQGSFDGQLNRFFNALTAGGIAIELWKNRHIGVAALNSILNLPHP